MAPDFATMFGTLAAQSVLSMAAIYKKGLPIETFEQVWTALDTACDTAIELARHHRVGPEAAAVYYRLTRDFDAADDPVVMPSIINMKGMLFTSGA